MAIATQYIQERQYMLAGLTVTHTPTNPGKGNSDVSTDAGEELWITYYEAAECKKEGTKARVYGYVIRDGEEHSVSLLTLDYDKLSNDIIQEARRSTGKQEPTINRKNLTQYARPVWIGHGFQLSKAAASPAKRRGGKDPTLTRQRNKDRILEPRAVADNDITMSMAEAKKLFKAYESKGAFDGGMYPRLRAAVQIYRGTEHQPPQVTLEAAKKWSEEGNKNPFHNGYYLKWEAGQVRNRREKKVKTRVKTWVEVFTEKTFTGHDLMWPGWIKVLADVMDNCERAEATVKANAEMRAKMRD
ncbi:hypothetical protein N0V95_001694 [Ascochyta clinopodiicola]|nr:hypothetical protein N0V95_001694 [Ascochyta clinopodiicola]